MVTCQTHILNSVGSIPTPNKCNVLVIIKYQTLITITVKLIVQMTFIGNKLSLSKESNGSNPLSFLFSV